MYTCAFIGTIGSGAMLSQFLPSVGNFTGTAQAAIGFALVASLYGVAYNWSLRGQTN